MLAMNTNQVAVYTLAGLRILLQLFLAFYSMTRINWLWPGLTISGVIILFTVGFMIFSQKRFSPRVQRAAIKAYSGTLVFCFVFLVVALIILIIRTDDMNNAFLGSHMDSNTKIALWAVWAYLFAYHIADLALVIRFRRIRNEELPKREVKLSEERKQYLARKRQLRKRKRYI